MPNRDYDILLSAGNAAQLEKLKKNEHKRGFDNIDLDYAWYRIQEEIEELREEMDAPIWRDLKAIMAEAADVANFAHMIILKCDQELNK